MKHIESEKILSRQNVAYHLPKYSGYTTIDQKRPEISFEETTLILKMIPFFLVLEACAWWVPEIEWVFSLIKNKMNFWHSFLYKRTVLGSFSWLTFEGWSFRNFVHENNKKRDLYKSASRFHLKKWGRNLHTLITYVHIYEEDKMSDWIWLKVIL